MYRRGFPTLSDPHRKRFKTLLTFAHELADRSGKVILPQFRRRITVEDKGGKLGYNPVTIADRAAERAIRTMIQERWPQHGVIGEEFPDTPGTSPYTWIIDPIDGTRSFIIGLPVWGTLIALMADEAPLLGIMDQPYTGERFWSDATASYCYGADKKRLKLKTRECPNIESAILTTTHPDLFTPGRQANTFKRLKSQVRDTRYGGDCYAYCLLAAGLIDIVMESNLKPHDIAALIPIVERAGGTITTWTGGPGATGGNIVACGDPRLHAQVLKIIA